MYIIHGSFKIIQNMNILFFSETDKQRQREKQFPPDCKAAYNLGVNLIRQANNTEK